MPSARRVVTASMGFLGFGCGMVAVWLGAEGIFRLARVGPPDAAVEWRAYGWLLAGIVFALLGAAVCLHTVRRVSGGAPPV